MPEICITYDEMLKEAIKVLEDEGYTEIKAKSSKEYNEPDKIRKSLLGPSYQPDITAVQNDTTFVFSIITEPFPASRGLEVFDSYTRKHDACLVFITRPAIRNVVESRLVSRGITATVI